MPRGRVVTVRITRALERQVALRAAADGVTPYEWMMLALEAPDVLGIADGAKRRTAVRYVQALRRHGLGRRPRVGQSALRGGLLPVGGSTDMKAWLLVLALVAPAAAQPV